MTDGHPILHVTELSAGYGPKTVIEDVRFALQPG